jgi:hypothetical protein
VHAGGSGGPECPGTAARALHAEAACLYHLKLTGSVEAHPPQGAAQLGSGLDGSPCCMLLRMAEVPVTRMLGEARASILYYL